jgi:serine/threonine protein kinase
MSVSKKREQTKVDDDLQGQLAGEYRIVRKLGAGGFGTVYEAEHPVLKRRAAVKVLHHLPGLDAVAVQRFIEEARSASQIRHRNIVDVFSFGTLPNGRYFYIMDLLEGAPLDRYLKEHGRLGPEQLLPLLRPIAHALDALHAAGLVHRDIKPANIYLAWEASGEVVPKLLDFGLVKLLARPTVNSISGVPLGTPHYMSPEQCRGDKVDGRADIYSLGIVCFEALSGSRPFSGDSATAVLMAQLLEKPPRLSELCPELNGELDAPLLAMLAKAPEERPSSALAALRALELSVQDAGISLADGPAWLPRLPPSAAEPAGTPAFEPGHATTFLPDQSGTRVQAASLRRRAWAIGLGSLLVAGLIGVLVLRSAGPVQPPSAAEWPTPSAAESLSPSAAADRPPTAANGLPPSAATSQPPSAATEQPPTPTNGLPPTAAEANPAAPTVSLTLRGAPVGASVFLGDRALGPAADPLRLPRGSEALQLRVQVPGHAAQLLRVIPNADRELTLPPEKPNRGSLRRVPRDLENPF